MESRNDNIIEGKEAVEGLLRGVSKIVSLIAPTYGGAGSDIIVETKLRPFNGIYNDAWNIIRAFRFNDLSEKRALAFIQELCELADRMSGDSRKTTILLCAEILRLGYEIKKDKKALKSELDSLIPFIESEIDAQARSISVNEISSVARTAAESKEIGDLIQNVYQEIGPEGIIDVEGSGTYETSYVVTDGIKFEMTGFLSASMVHDEQAISDKVQETKAVYENPLILVTKNKITTDDDINPLLWEMKQQGSKDLVIFTSDMDSGVASMLIGLHMKKDFNVCIIKAPVLWKDFVYEDFARCTGATIVEDATGLNFKNLQLSHLGTCGKIIVDEEETTLRGTRDITEHKKRLQEKGDEDSLRRLAWLTNKTAVIKLGSNGATDLSGKRLKCNDAVRSSSMALKYGIVPGGGLAFLNVSRRLPNTDAGNLLKSALQYPMALNMANAGHSPEYRKSWWQFWKNEPIEYAFFHREAGDSVGYNSKTNEVCDMFSEGIVDSSKTLKNSVRNAIGIASTMLTQKGIVYIPPMTPEEMAYKTSMNATYDF